MKLGALAAVVLLSAACDARPNQFPIGFDRMRDQPRYDPYQRSGYFGDGTTMRPLPRGTVAVESPVGRAGAAAQATAIPVQITRERLERGRNRYDIFCRPCHDVDGSAQSPVAQNMQLRRPPSLLDSRIRQLPVGRIYQAIAEGYGLMPSYARQLRDDERWDVVAYVRALELRDRIAVADLPADVRAEAQRALGRGGPR